ncbi:hypothetical protein [Lactobacillus sp. ESL0228]|uniref:hypothetical protein n=1 Tax=Lactobacillus sp. ESL0228 TaxID=2069352 RepID=UPI000EFAB8DF|nr:hypothetical protein [Lactobacillus sp. ESL0228]RMC47340.1 hypothetical protein F5ESL0228_07795 [Lactobacillus sp. ESL0228]
MHNKNSFTNLPQHLLRANPTQELLKRVQQVTNFVPKVWQKLCDKNYTWTKTGLQQVQHLLLVCAKHSKHVQKQLTSLLQPANSELIPVFKNQKFLKLLAHKMKLSPHTIQTITSLLDQFDQKNGSFSSGTLLVIVLFIALGTQVPLLFKGTFSAKKALMSVITILDYVMTAIDLAKNFQNNKNK